MDTKGNVPKSDFFDDALAEKLQDPKFRNIYDSRRLPSDISNVLIGMRKRANMKQREVAEVTGWKQPFVARMESAAQKRPHSLDKVQQFAEACGVTAAITFVDPVTREILESVPLGNSPDDVSLFNNLTGGSGEFEVTEVAAPETNGFSEPTTAGYAPLEISDSDFEQDTTFQEAIIDQERPYDQSDIDGIAALANADEIEMA